MKLKKYCEGKGFVFIENVNISEPGLNNSKLHLNKKGTNVLTQNIKRSFSQFWSSDRHTREVDITNSNFFENNETDQVLKVLRNNNPSNLNFCYLNINSVRNKFTNLQTIIVRGVSQSIVQIVIKAWNFAHNLRIAYYFQKVTDTLRKSTGDPDFIITILGGHSDLKIAHLKTFGNNNCAFSPKDDPVLHL